MSDFVGVGIIVLVALFGLIGLAQLTKPYNVTTEEFEKRAKEGPGLLGAGLISIQKLLDPAAEKAAEVQEDLRQGRYDGEQGAGDGPEAGNDDSIKT
ncbi:MAG TPA: hypothetical protein VI750_11230 [Pyrinomonadaceae bacterium]|nr:hypothetical protein [Pyrinomonadaceae bacterium]HLE63708.1 hypothetical protein [Pyrinomonadaceae bacterium]